VDIEMERKCQKILNKYFKEEGNVISLLQHMQNEFGYIPDEVVYWFANELNIPASNFFGVATFYAQFHLKPRGRHIITACCGTACHVKGADPVVNRIRADLALAEGEETTPDMHFTLESVACIGACSMAPVVKINKRIFGSVTPDKATELIDTFSHEKGK
jgi:NADH:ubiquinone oxidoreductase subunit E